VARSRLAAIAYQAGHITQRELWRLIGIERRHEHVEEQDRLAAHRFSGSLHEIEAFNWALSSSEIAELQAGRVTPERLRARHG
jgi:hypothetical protein